MSSSELSSPLSSLPSDDGEIPELLLDVPDGAAAIASDDEPATPASTASSAIKRKREESPPHEAVLADNPDIAFIVMFRSRFSEVFPPKLAGFGPQDIERGVVDSVPSPQVEGLLCALLALVLNRKKPIERGHYGRALEEALQTQRSQWPRAWNGVNPLAGSRTFNSMAPQERLNLLRALVLWALNTSDAITTIIKESYKQSRHDDDLNQPLSVHPWGKDGLKRRYWLIEGRDDTTFRLYREGSSTAKEHTWRSMAGSIEELHGVAEKLQQDGSQAARRLGDRITAAIPRFEASEEKRKRREYRMARKAQFQRPEPGFSLYEGRTRGKRMRYTFDDEDEDDFSLSDSTPTRRSTRNSGVVTPADPNRPTVTASGRQVRARVGGLYGETLHSGQTSTGRASPATENYERSEASEEPPVAPGGRSTRSAGRAGVNGWTRGGPHIEGYNSVDEMDDEDEATSSGVEWEGGDEDEPDDMDDDMDEDDDDEDRFEEDEPQSLIVKLRYGRRSAAISISHPEIHQTLPLPPSASTPLIKVSPPVSATAHGKLQLFTSDVAVSINGSHANVSRPETFSRSAPPGIAVARVPELPQPDTLMNWQGFGASTLPYSPPKPLPTPNVSAMQPVQQQTAYPTPASIAASDAPNPFQRESEPPVHQHQNATTDAPNPFPQGSEPPVHPHQNVATDAATDAATNAATDPYSQRHLSAW